MKTGIFLGLLASLCCIAPLQAAAAAYIRMNEI